MDRAVIMKPQDNVATCLADLKAGSVETISIRGAPTSIAIKQDIPFGHKIALSDIAAGEHIIKYAEVIGAASKTIVVGEHVHIHNVESIRARGDKA
ncbi:MAG: UxaA family hydrolase [Pseudomonadota bacterium]